MWWMSYKLAITLFSGKEHLLCFDQITLFPKHFEVHFAHSYCMTFVKYNQLAIFDTSSVPRSLLSPWNTCTTRWRKRLQHFENIFTKQSNNKLLTNDQLVYHSILPVSLLLIVGLVPSTLFKARGIHSPYSRLKDFSKGLSSLEGLF